jgi:hypothetical protein
MRRRSGIDGEQLCPSYPPFRAFPDVICKEGPDLGGSLAEESNCTSHADRLLCKQWCSIANGIFRRGSGSIIGPNPKFAPGLDV